MLGTLTRVLLTAAVVLIAVAVVAYKYWDYVTNPWTRDGQVRAQVIQITPRVSGPIVQLPIADNQLVKTGDLLFEIDPRTFQAALDQARADLDQTRDNIESLAEQVNAAKAAVAQYDALIQQGESIVKERDAELADASATLQRVKDAGQAVSELQIDNAQAAYNVALASKEEAEGKLLEATAQRLEAQAQQAQAEAELGAPGDDNPQLRAAKAAVESAELDLEFTEVKAPVDGYVTILDLRLGSQAVENEPALALVDIQSYWVHGFFKENVIEDMRAGDRAIVTLMSYPDHPLEGEVDSLGWGIAQDDGSTGFDLLPNISATFEWIRLAQRVPVRVHLIDVPPEVRLRVGTTASVLVMTGTHDTESAETVPAAPKALQ